MSLRIAMWLGCRNVLGFSGFELIVLELMVLLISPNWYFLPLRVVMHKCYYNLQMLIYAFFNFMNAI